MQPGVAANGSKNSLQEVRPQSLRTPDNVHLDADRSAIRFEQPHLGRSPVLRLDPTMRPSTPMLLIFWFPLPHRMGPSACQRHQKSARRWGLSVARVALRYRLR